MPLLPLCTNDEYDGPMVAAYFLALFGVPLTAPGRIHALNACLLTGAGATHHPPEHHALQVGLPLLLAARAPSLRHRTGAP